MASIMILVAKNVQRVGLWHLLLLGGDSRRIRAQIIVSTDAGKETVTRCRSCRETGLTPTGCAQVAQANPADGFSVAPPGEKSYNRLALPRLPLGGADPFQSMYQKAETGGTLGIWLCIYCLVILGEQPMKSIFESCEPRTEMLKGELRDDIFAARLND
jgi:hypothetical protein